MLRLLHISVRLGALLTAMWQKRKAPRAKSESVAVGEGEELFRAPRRRDDAARLGVEQEFHGAPAEVPGSSRDDQCSPTEIHDTATFPHATFSTIFPRA